MRNAAKRLPSYRNSIKKIVETYKSDFDFILSIYENDSTDGTQQVLNSLSWDFVEHYIVSEQIQTKFYGSIKAEDRVKNLATARNKAITHKDLYKRCDLILAVESDIEYETEAVGSLLYFQETHNLEKVDLVSAISWKKDNKRKIYDTWGTRRNEIEERGILHRDWQSHKYQKYYGTFNCLCLMSAEPFKNGIFYHWYNDRLSKFDCDTIVLCEKFHENNYKEIYINYESECFQ